LYNFYKFNIKKKNFIIFIQEQIMIFILNITKMLTKLLFYFLNKLSYLNINSPLNQFELISSPSSYFNFDIISNIISISDFNNYFILCFTCFIFSSLYYFVSLLKNIIFKFFVLFLGIFKKISWMLLIIIIRIILTFGRSLVLISYAVIGVEINPTDIIPFDSDYLQIEQIRSFLEETNIIYYDSMSIQLQLAELELVCSAEEFDKQVEPILDEINDAIVTHGIDLVKDSLSMESMLTTENSETHVGTAITNWEVIEKIAKEFPKA